VRFDRQDEDVDCEFRRMLNRLQNQLDFSPNIAGPHDWSGEEPVFGAYETGSRLAFLAFDLQPDMWRADSDANFSGPYAIQAYNSLVVRQLSVEGSRQREVYQQLLYRTELMIGRQWPYRWLAEENDPTVIGLAQKWQVCISDLIERERILSSWFADSIFLFHLCHGTMNSLGFSRQDEARMYRSIIPTFR